MENKPDNRPKMRLSFEGKSIEVPYDGTSCQDMIESFMVFLQLTGFHKDTVEDSIVEIADDVERK